MSFNIEEDAIDIYLLHNGYKIRSKDPNKNNYCRIIGKDIGVSDEFTTLEFEIVNNIRISINIKFKNKFLNQGISVKERLKFLNNNISKKQEPKPVTKYEINENEEEKEEKIETNNFKTPQKQMSNIKINNQKSISTKNVQKKAPTSNSQTIPKNNTICSKDAKKPKKLKNNRIQLPEKRQTEISKPASSNIVKPFPTPEKLNIDIKSKIEKLNAIFKANPHRVPTMIAEDANEEVFDSFCIIEKEAPSHEIFLKPESYANFLKEKEEKKEFDYTRETLCKGFFIASFSKKNGKVIEGSEPFPSLCEHPDCSQLPAMKPEILHRYPLKDLPDLEINNVLASICFPQGIKLCYDDSYPPAIAPFLSSLTNQFGDRYYLMAYYFYLQLEIDEFQEYEEHPLKYILRKFTDLSNDIIDLNEKDQKEAQAKIEENFQFCEKFSFKDKVFIPFCISLIFQYPYFNDITRCLSSIYLSLKQDENFQNKICVNDLIMYLIHGIPIPSQNSSLKFLLPFDNNYIEIRHPKTNDQILMNGGAINLLNNFSIENLIIIFRLIIFEKKILVVGKDNSKIARISDGFLSILYPFKWPHVYIPVVTEQMLNYLGTFMPFISGINESFLPFVKNILAEGNKEDADEVILMYMDVDKIKLSSSLQGKKLTLKKYLNDKIPQLPNQLESNMKTRLKRVKGELENVIKNKNLINLDIYESLEFKIRDVFVDFFVEILYDYKQYLCFLEEDAIFNKTLFLEKKPNADKHFYKELIETQLFQQFLISEDSSKYFKEKVSLRAQKKNYQYFQYTGKLKEYCINPSFLHIQNSGNNIKDLLPELQSIYPGYYELIRIIDCNFEILEENYNCDKCNIYLTDEEKENHKKKKKIDNFDNEEKHSVRQRTPTASLFTSKQQKDDLGKEDVDSIKERIKDNITKILQSEELTLNQTEKAELQNTLTMPVGRNFFISLLSKNTSNIILLKENSLYLLWNLIYDCLIFMLNLDETDEILENIVLLIKSTKYFGISLNGKTITMMERNVQSLQNITKIKQDNFWKMWFDTEIKYRGVSTDEEKQNSILNICKTMIFLDISKTWTKKVIDKLNAYNFKKDSPIFKKTAESAINLIITANSRAF